MRAAIAGSTPIDDDFVFSLSRAIPDYAFERDAAGRLIVAPNHTDGGRKSGEAYYQLRRWADAYRAGSQTFDASTGFRLPDSSLVSPDAAWLSTERISALPPSARVGYWQVAPEIAIEVASPSDTWRDVRAKIDAYHANGTVYAIAIDPATGEFYARGNPPAELILDIAAIANA
jgi:Uma2 family endonuclease